MLSKSLYWCQWPGQAWQSFQGPRMGWVFPSYSLTKVQIIPRITEEYDQVILHIKIIHMIFRMCIKKKVFTCGI